MKESKLCTLFLLLCFFCGAALVSCSDDDDEPDTGSASDELVGTWMMGDDWGFSFYPDGTCITYDDYGQGQWIGTYVIRSGYLYIFSDKYDEPEIFESFSVYGNSLFLVDTSGETYIFYRQEEDGVDGEDNDELVGTWMDSDGDFGYRFNSDMTFICYDDDGSIYRGTYRVLASGGSGTLLLYWNDGETWEVPYVLQTARLVLTFDFDKGNDVLYKQD